MQKWDRWVKDYEAATAPVPDPAKVAALKQVTSGVSESGAPRERSRSPRQSQGLPVNSGA